jgi:hypothetical protein
MNLIQRIQSPTPPFFKKLRRVGLILAALSAAIIASPVALPVIVVNAAGYLAVAGGVVTAVSQVATKTDDAEQSASEGKNDNE